MPASTQSDPFEGLREQLSRADRVLGFARKLKHDSGSVPPGLSQDFSQVRNGLEKEFVMVHDRLPEKIRERLKEFLIRSRGLNNEGVDQNLEKLARRTRSLLNELVIDGHGLELTEESFADDLLTSPPGKRPEVRADVVHGSPQPAPPASLKPLWIALGALGVLVVLTLVIVLSGILNPMPMPNLVANMPNEPRRDGTPRDEGKDMPPQPAFNAKAAGYGKSLSVLALSLLIDVLELDPARLAPEDLPTLQLGLEQLIEIAEPARLRMGHEQTAQAMRDFARGVVDNEKAWIAARKPLLEAVVEHARKTLQFSVYPAGEQLLVSDFLADKGAPRATALVSLTALARSAGCPMEIIAPTSPDYPMLAIQLPSGTATFDGESFAQRPLPENAMPVARLLDRQLQALRPTLKTPGARAAISLALLRCNAALTADQRAQALADLSDEMFAPPPQDDNADARRARLFFGVAQALIKYLGPATLDTGDDASEALRIYRLASAAKDDVLAQRAMVEVGKRAAKGALIDGQPVMLVVGDLMRSRNDFEAAAAYYKRAMDEFPDDPRAPLRLAELAPAGEKLALLRQAYARGERAAAFLREFGRELGKQGEALATLAILDDLCESPEATLEDFVAQATACIALDKPDWAQLRLSKADKFKEEAVIQRLELIVELSLNGASDRAKRLAQAYPGRTTDAQVAGLLRRYGIE